MPNRLCADVKLERTANSVNLFSKPKQASLSQLCKVGDASSSAHAYDRLNSKQLLTSGRFHACSTGWHRTSAHFVARRGEGPRMHRWRPVPYLPPPFLCLHMHVCVGETATATGCCWWWWWWWYILCVWGVSILQGEWLKTIKTPSFYNLKKTTNHPKKLFFGQEFNVFVVRFVEAICEAGLRNFDLTAVHSSLREAQICVKKDRKSIEKQETNKKTFVETFPQNFKKKKNWIKCDFNIPN